MTPGILEDLFWMETRVTQTKLWASQIDETLTGGDPGRKFFHKIAVPELLELTDRGELAGKMLLSCQGYLQQRVDNKPKPPRDWSRKVPSSRKYQAEWAELKAFLSSADLQVFDYRKPQALRRDMEQAIRSVTIDLSIETIRKGSPQTLRITKTRAAFDRDLADWKQDSALLMKVNRKLSE